MGTRKIYKLDGKSVVINKRANAGQRMYLQSTTGPEEWMVEKRYNNKTGQYKHVKAIDLGNYRTHWIPATFKPTNKTKNVKGKQLVRPSYMDVFIEK